MSDEVRNSLLVTQNMSLADTLTYNLYRLRYQVSGARSEGEASNSARQVDLALAVIDYAMPETDCAALAKKFCKSFRIPVILLADRKLEPSDAKFVQELDNLEVLDKPRSLELLAWKIGKLCK